MLGTREALGGGGAPEIRRTYYLVKARSKNQIIKTNENPILFSLTTL